MDGTYRIKANIGSNTFEAEGPTEIVRADFQTWRELVSVNPAPANPQPQNEPPVPESGPRTSYSKAEVAAIDDAIGKIMSVDNRIVVLTARPKSAEDAVLLILYGQRMLRSNDSVTGSEVFSGVTAIGGLGVTRVDRILEKAGADGDVIVTGERRAKRYRLTILGLSKARALATDLLATVA